MLPTSPQSVSAFTIQWNKNRPLIALAVFVLEAALLVFAYRYDFAGLLARPADSSLCMQVMSSQAVCTTLATLPPMALLLIIIGFFLLFLHPQSELYARFAAKVRSCDQPNFWLGLNFAGFASILAVYFLTLSDISPRGLAVLGPILWGFGSLAFVLGLALWLLPISEIRKLLDLKVIAGVAFLVAIPQLEAVIGSKLWLETWLQEATVEMTIRFLLFFDQPVVWDGDIAIGIDSFGVLIAFSCAGVSGIAFSSGAMAGYIIWMRDQLNIPRTLITIPLIALLSWTFNAFRIAVLIMIGEYYSPTLALEGFHSYAGWISFSMLTGAMVFAVDRIGWFQKAGKTARPRSATSLLNDPMSAQILPFTVFLFSSLIVGAFFDPPALGYPYRVLLTAVCLIAFWRCLPARVNWKIDPVAALAGVAVAVMWLLGQPDAEGSLEEKVPGLTGTALFVWVVVRVFGTSILVPVIEELFFRGYLLNRLNFGGKHGALIALVASSALFAALHGNLLLAFVAGLIFGWLVMRTGRVLDAVYSHAIANGLIALFALLTNNWSVI